VNTSILERVQRISADVFEIPVDGIEKSSSADTIETWDSLHHLNLVLALEQEFTVEFSPEEIEQMLSIELVTDLVGEKLRASEKAFGAA
jgi:acyl carrier protein